MKMQTQAIYNETLDIEFEPDLLISLKAEG